jgi:hypothetical protein
MRTSRLIKSCAVVGVAAAIGFCVTKSSADAPAGRYILSSGTVRDTKTGLVWTLSAGAPVPLASAETRCANLTLADSYWRLPSMKEIQTLIDPTGVPHLDLTAFGSISPGGTPIYWTSSAVVGSANESWTLTWYGDGYPQLRPWTSEANAYSRCVLVGPRPPSDGGADAPLPPTTMFADDFEDGVFDGWTLGTASATHTVTDTVAAAGTTRSLRIRGGAWYAGANRMFGPFQPARASFWVRIARAAGSGTGTFALSADSAASQHIVQFFAYDSFFQFGGNPLLNTAGIVPELNRWYHVELDLNWTTRRFTARVDGATIGETAFGASAATSLARLDIFNSTETADVYFDEIVLGP